MNYKKPIFLALLLISIGGLYAQESSCSTGGEASGTGGTSSYSCNYIVYNTDIAENGSVSQGVQQPFEISVVTSIHESKFINLTFDAYPNPTTDFLILKTKIQKHDELTFMLYNSNGQLLESNWINDSETKINMMNHKTDSYIIKIYQNNSEIKTFKIIKTK